MGALSTVILPDPIRTINSATFTGSYQTVGTPTTKTMRIVKFTNLSNVTVTLSWDGVNDHEILPANSFDLFDVAGNRESSDIFEVQIGTQFYAKGSAGTGNFYISCYYGKVANTSYP